MVCCDCVSVTNAKEELELMNEFNEYAAMMDDLTEKLRSEIAHLKTENAT